MMRLVERRSASSAFGLDPFRAKAGGDAFLGAISAIFVVGINRVCAYSFDPNAGEFFLIFNACLEPYAFIECLERVVFDERDTSNLDIIDLRTELDPFVFLSAHDRSQIGSVNADDATSDFLFIHKVELLTSYFFLTSSLRTPKIFIKEFGDFLIALRYFHRTVSLYDAR